MKTLRDKIYDLTDEINYVEEENFILGETLKKIRESLNSFMDAFDVIEEENSFLKERLKDIRIKLCNITEEILKKNENINLLSKGTEVPLKNGTFGCISNPCSGAERWFILIENEGKFYLIYENGGYDTIGDAIEDSFNKTGYSQKTGRAISFLVNATHFDMAKQIKKHYESHCGDDTDEDVLFYRN